MELKMHLKYGDKIEYLIARYPFFSSLKDVEIWEYDINDLADYFDGKTSTVSKNGIYRWTVPKTVYFGGVEEVSVLPVMFIGKTGYGKSSLLNEIIGKSVFPTNDFRSCTTEIDAAFFQLTSGKPFYLSFSDFPGVGESESADKKYMQWYKDMVKCSPCVVYVLRADQRDYAIDLMAFNTLFSTEEEKEKVIIALNYADKIEPLSRSLILSDEQLEALDAKVDTVSDVFGIDSYKIFPCSASTGFGLSDLVNEIVDALDYCVF